MAYCMQSWLSFVGVSCSAMSDVSNNGGKYGSRRSTLNPWVRTNEQWDVELEGSVTDSLGDGVWPISEWVKLVVGSIKVILLQM